MGKIFKTIWVGLNFGKVQVGLCQVTAKLSADFRSSVGGCLGRPTLAGNVFGLCVRAGFGAQNCQPALHLNRSTKLQVCTSPRLTQNPCYKPFFYFHVLDSPSPNSKYRLFAFITIKFCLVLVIAV